MKTVTLEQPWATLVAMGLKTMITRPDPTAYVGPLTIYAAKTALVIDDPYIRRVLASAGYSGEDLPSETVVATANLVKCQKITNANIPCYPEYAFSDFREGWYAWILADIEAVTP